MRHLSAAAAAPASAPNGQPVESGSSRSETLVQSYRQLADVFHDILSEHSLDNLLERIADALAELVPHDTLSIYQADEAQTILIPVFARDKWADNILSDQSNFGEGITGWAALHREPVRTNQAHRDPRRKTVPGTPADEPEALITVPLIARDLANLLRGALRGSDVVCRLGGEEFGVVMPSCDAGDALNLGRRLTDSLEQVDFGPASKITISVGISQGPEHAMNPRELVACAEAAMMTAKARGKSRIVVYDGGATERPTESDTDRDARSIAHLKMLQSLAGRLNRLNDVREIGEAIVSE